MDPKFKNAGRYAELALIPILIGAIFWQLNKREEPSPPVTKAEAYDVRNQVSPDLCPAMMEGCLCIALPTGGYTAVPPPELDKLTPRDCQP